MTTLVMAADKIGSRITSWFKRQAEEQARLARVRATIKELESLSDMELNDIGINRGMIRSIAEEIK